jgi:hypothetical protein
MKTYTIITKAGVTTTVQAFGYTEDKTFGRIYFHQDENRSDRDNFLFLSEVAGILQRDASFPLRIEEKDRLGEFKVHGNAG